MNQPAIDPALVKGWAIDADPENDPTYPMKQRSGSEHAGYRWRRPPQQPAEVEVLHSNERPNLSAVFGTSVPPSGLSGLLRRLAFRDSESGYGHWLPLMLADRVGVVEAFAQDLAHGYLPNLPKELGWGAEWKHNRASLVTRVLLGAAAVATVLALFHRRHED